MCIRDSLKRADTAYYKHDDPIMTDREYDALFDELKMLEDNSGIVPVSYTHLDVYKRQVYRT